MRRTSFRGHGVILAMSGLLAIASPAAAENEVKKAASDAMEATADAAGKAADVVSDSWITTKVKMSLLTTEGAPAASVHVDTSDGRVTLYGTADSALEKSKAEAVAREVRGVRDVRNLIDLAQRGPSQTAAVADEALASRVQEALAKDPALSDGTVKVASVKSGVVLLTGKAPTMTEHGRALRTASRVPGVKRVTSTIESPDTLAETEVWREGGYDAALYERSSARDSWITTAVKVRLLASSDTPGMDVSVDTEDGVVTLFGVVDSDRAKQASSLEAQKVGGVREVRNSLQIVPVSKQAVVEARDEDVQRAIEKRLGERGDLGTSAVTVDVKKGIARLTGKVESPSDRLVVLTVARSTTGVRGLIDDLHLETPAVSTR